MPAAPAPAQEIFDNGIDIDASAVVHVWKWWWPVASSPAASAYLGSAQNDSSSSFQTAQPVCQLSRGCFPPAAAGARVEGDDAAGNDAPPAWTNAIAAVTKKVLRSSLSHNLLREFPSQD